MFNSFISKIEPKMIKIVLDQADWVLSMQHELNEFECNNVWRSIPIPPNDLVVILKWVFHNKHDK